MGTSAYNSTAYELGVRNLDGVIANLYAADRDAQDAMRGAVEETAHDVSDLTVMLSPKDTLFMSQHVRERFTENGFGFDVGWDAADFFEQGYAFYPFFQEFGTSRMMAQPSLGPAWEQIKPQHRERVSRVLRDAFARRARGRAT